MNELLLADVLAPMNEEGTKATILKWGKRVGDRVRRDEPLLELETDKVTVEIACPASGELAEILKGPDEEVLPGQLLARVRVEPGQDRPADQGEPQATEPVKTEPVKTQPLHTGARGLLSPAVRKLLAEHRLAADQIQGTGHDGRITADDVMAAAKRVGAQASPRIPHSPMRRRIAEHMVRSLEQAPHVTTLFEADLTRVAAHRARSAAVFEQRGVHLTFTAYFIVACARALRAHPEVNATFHEDCLELHADANIGVGTALGNQGLIVPVLHRAQALSLFDVAERLGKLVAAARTGKLDPADVRGGTFTISNHGVGGSLLAAPIIINQPQVAILGIGKVERRVCAMTIDGAEMMAIRSKCYLTLTIDHRAIDAFQANAFLANVVEVLEQWPAA